MNFNFSNTYTLENDRVLLRPLTKEDIKHLLNFAMEEPEIWKYSLVSGSGKENLTKYIELAISKRANSNNSVAYK